MNNKLLKLIKKNICILDNKYNILITNKNIAETKFYKYWIHYIFKKNYIYILN